MSAGRGKYQEIADELRRKILDGRYRPAEMLPSLAEIAEQYGTTQNTAARAIDVLRHEGLAHTEPQRGTFVRPTLPARRVAMSRYRGDAEQAAGDLPRSTPFTRDLGIDWSEQETTATIDRVPAAGEAAELMQVPPGTELLRRRLLFAVRGFPQQVSTSVFLAAPFRGTPVEDPEREPWPGGSIAQLATIGVEVTAVEERVRSRMPTPDERRELRIPDGVPVLTVTRVMFSGDRPVEAAVDIVIPADRVELWYRIEL